MGEGEEGAETEMTTRRMSRGGGEAEERKVDFAAQCQDPKNNNPVFLLLSEWGIFFLPWQMVDGTCLATESSLALLQKFPLHCSGQHPLQDKWKALSFTQGNVQNRGRFGLL